MYCRIRQGISPLLFAAMLLYYPGCVLLRLWLPKYEVSVSYLGMLLPLIIYTSKVSLLTNNYLKAYQQERTMLRINASCVAAGLALFALGAWVLNSLTAVLLLVLLSVMLRSMLSEAAVMRIIHVDLRWEFVIEFALTAVFLISTCLLPYWWGLGVYGAALGGYRWANAGICGSWRTRCGEHRKECSYMKIAIAGMGYVGLSQAVLLAQHNSVCVVDVAAEKVDMLNRGISPIQDSYLDAYLNKPHLRLRATLDPEDGYSGAEYVVIAVPTDFNPRENAFDTAMVESVIRQVLRYAPEAVMVIKSTVPGGLHPVHAVQISGRPYSGQSGIPPGGEGSVR